MTVVLWQLLGSLAAVVALVAVAWALGFRQVARLASDEEAFELFRLAPGGFEPVEVSIDTDSRGAIARDAGGRIAVLVPHGNHFVFRRLPRRTAIVATDGILSIRGQPHVRMDLRTDSRRWANTDIGDNND